MKVLCSVYRSPKKEGMYLYVEKKTGLDNIPELLLKQFGTPELAMTLIISPETKLARAEASGVLDQINQEGFYLQMPPQADEAMKAIHTKNSKMNKL